MSERLPTAPGLSDHIVSSYQASKVINQGHEVLGSPPGGQRYPRIVLIQSSKHICHSSFPRPPDNNLHVIFFLPSIVKAVTGDRPRLSIPHLASVHFNPSDFIRSNVYPSLVTALFLVYSRLLVGSPGYW